MNDFCVAVMKGVSAIMHANPVCVTIIMYCTKEHPKIIVKTADKFANYVEPNSITCCLVGDSQYGVFVFDTRSNSVLILKLFSCKNYITISPISDHLPLLA